ncbi:unnamed protein product [Thelazia callipaeda]|uniref:FAM184 domain-containing protein n=1 Tax=Thelazia callipaeda TaxID=103827 RepID=A0A0N5CMX1_THECL|nr:unnamed protein product [Thelazia callipaeda]
MLGYLSDEFEELSPSSHLRSASPNIINSDLKSQHLKSKSPRPYNNSAEICDNCSPQINVIKDSRPDIIAWPTPPNVQNCNGITNQENNSEESTKLLSILKSASSTAPRGRESELKKKIQTLEDTVAEYERQKYNVMGTFSEYRERVAERERKLEAEYSSKIIALSEEVLGAKKDFEARMKSFQALQEKFEREKEQALEKLRQEHQKEIELLEQRFSESQLLNLEQKYMIEIQRLEEERKSLKAEKERLGETFETKLRRAQSLYETELTAAKMLYSKELEALRDHEEALKEELLARQDEFHDRLQELQHQTKQSREELANCKNEVAALEQRLQVKEAEVVAISKELEEARNETNDSLRKLSKVEIELQETKHQYRQQEEKLQRKSSLLNIVETAKSKLEAFIRDLQTEVKALKNKVDFLEKERENLQSQSESQSKLQNSQVNALEAVLESVTKEKESTKDRYESLLETERQQAEEREYAMKKEFSSKLNELESQYSSLRDHLEHEVKRSEEQEVSNLKHENRLLTTEVHELKRRLELLMECSEDGGDETVQKIRQLFDESDQLKNEVKKCKKLLNEKEIEIKKMEQEFKHHPSRITNEQNKFRMVDSLFHLEETKKSNAEIDTLAAELENKTVLNENLIKAGIESENSMETSKDYSVQNQNDCRKNRVENSVTIQKLVDEIYEKQKQIEALEKNERCLKEEFQTRLAERVEEETSKILLNYETKTGIIKSEIDQKTGLRGTFQKMKLEENVMILKNDCDLKNKQINELMDKNQKLISELSAVKSELEKKSMEIKNFTKKTDEYLRRRENQQVQILEKKIANLNKEHERKTEIMRKHELELINKYHKLQQQLKLSRTDINLTGAINGAQTTINNENQVNANGENLQFIEQIQHLQNTLKEKDAFIEQLRKTLELVQESQLDSKQNRSHSFTAGENSKIQTSTSNLQILLTEVHDQCKEDTKVKESSELMKGKRKKEEGEKDKSNYGVTGIPRPKSPAYSARIHERSPTKSKSPTVDSGKQKDDKGKNLLCPESDRPLSSEDRRRGSPVHPSSFRVKKETSTTIIASSNTKDESKRPAWKF